MEGMTASKISVSAYDRALCDIGIVHLGFGAFHRAHQAVYIDEYMSQTQDLRWGIAAINLRAAESDTFATTAQNIDDNDGYFLKSVSPDNFVHYGRIRPHVAFSDWAQDAEAAESYLALPSVKLVTITVTESGYYTNTSGALDESHSLIAAELQGTNKQSVYAYLRSALQLRSQTIDMPITIACCDNIRQNGAMLKRNLLSYLAAAGDKELQSWVAENVAFPCSMVDRITPRPPESLAQEFSQMTGSTVLSPIMCEDYLQWVLSDLAAAEMPDLGAVGVTVTSDVDPYEETKIRVLNGGHTALAYMAALQNIDTFDQAMQSPELRQHFENFEVKEVLPALTIDVPFAKDEYQQKTARRFSNQAIGDTVARICADGMAKFPIFIRPTIEGCFANGIEPTYAIQSIASWYVFARHVQAGKIPFEYIEPGWQELASMLGNDSFLTSTQLWGTIPQDYPKFIEMLQCAITEWEEKWPV